MFLRSMSELRSLGLVAAMGLIPLGGCAIVDQYGSRAIEYNDQAAASKSSTILLNIMRAAYREPLQFTDLSTVTGLASAQGSLNASIPARIGGHFTTADLLTINPGALISGGPQFNIANLNSQEFYQGLQGPVPAQVIALYAQAGVPLRVLLPLFVSEIEIDDAKANKKWIIHGSGPLTQITYGEFLSALDLLLTEGLAMEPEPTDEKIGPALKLEKASDPKLLTGVLQAMATASSGSGSSFKFEQNKQGGFQLTKKSNKWRFCFQTSLPKPVPNWDVGTYIPLSEKLEPFSLRFGYYPNQTPISMRVTRDVNFVCGAKAKNPASSGAEIQVTSNMKFRLRSVEGIFLFLGEMTRTQLGIDSGVPTPLIDPNGGPDKQRKAYDPLRGPEYLFRVEPRPPSSYLEISATLAGIPYTISPDPSGTDASTLVVQILTDLLALQSSAKSLPAPNVIAVAP